MVTTLHTGIGTYSRGTGVRARAMWLAYRRLVLRSPRPVYVAISDAVLDSFRPFLPPGVETLVIENGVPLRAMHPTTPEERLEARASLGLPPDGCVIAYVGRMRPEKGHVCLVEAFGRGLRDLPDAYLVLAGDGPERPAVERALAQAGLGDRIRQLGTVDKPDTVLRASDLFAIPSTREGFGLVVIEAFAFGLPVVASAVDALPALVADGRNGVLVPPSDPIALGRALRAIVTDAHYRARLAEGARAKDLTPWSIERAARAYEDLYRRLAPPAHM
jgi:glycosyltransferase involved in cell wall biosynthesis